VAGLDLDVIFEAEPVFKGARSDPLMKELLLGRLDLLAGDGKEVLLRRDGDLVLREPGKGEGNAVGVLARPGDVVGRPIGLPFENSGVVEKIENAVEADARPPQGR